MNPKHLSLTEDHYTPPKIAVLARALMGRIDVDPASSSIANKIIKADKIFTKTDNGLIRPWHGRVFLNPPGGKTKNKSNLGLWWQKLLAEYESGRATEAVFLSFQLSIFKIEQSVFDFPFIVPRQRLRFYSFDPKTNSLKPGQADENGVWRDRPSHDNAIIYLPPKESFSQSAKLFLEIFSPVGRGKL